MGNGFGGYDYSFGYWSCFLCGGLGFIDGNDGEVMDNFEDIKQIQSKGAICYALIVPLCMIFFSLAGFWIDRTVGTLEFKTHHIPIYSLIGLHLGLFMSIFLSIKVMKTSA